MYITIAHLPNFSPSYTETLSPLNTNSHFLLLAKSIFFKDLQVSLSTSTHPAQLSSFQITFEVEEDYFPL